MSGEQALDNSKLVQTELSKAVLPERGAPVPAQTTAHTPSQLSELKNPGSALPENVGQAAQTRQVLRLEDLLPAETIRTIRETPQTEYRIRAFVKEIDGQLRSLLLVGETHKKDDAAFIQGDRLAQGFNYSAVEGVVLSRYWGGKALDVLMGAYHRINTFFGDKTHRNGSTIDLVEGQAGLENVKDSIAKRVSEVIKKHQLTPNSRDGWNDIPVSVVQGHTTSMADIATMKLEAAGAKVTGEQILDAAFEMAQSPDTGRAPPRKATKIFPLEDNHTPTLTEQIGMFYLPALVASNAMVFAWPFLPDGPVITPLKWASAAIAIPALIGSYSSKLLHKQFYDKPWMPYLKAGLLGAVVNERNKTFVSSLNAIFQDNREVDKLLAIVGRGHVPGVSHSLSNEHGWRELDVPGQEAGY